MIHDRGRVLAGRGRAPAHRDRAGVIQRPQPFHCSATISASRSLARVTASGAETLCPASARERRRAHTDVETSSTAAASTNPPVSCARFAAICKPSSPVKGANVATPSSTTPTTAAATANRGHQALPSRMTTIPGPPPHVYWAKAENGLTEQPRPRSGSPVHCHSS